MLKTSWIMTMATVAMLAAAPVAAATVVADETSVKGSDFGNNPKRAEVFGADILTVTGSQKNNRDSDFLTFDGFADGTESLDFVFTNPGGAWGGFNIRIKEDPFRNKHDWWPLAFWTTESGVSDSNPVKISFALNGYTGPLHVALDFFHADFRNGNGIQYTISKTGGVLPSPGPAPAPVPLPAALPLAAAGLGSLVLLRRFGKG